VGAGGGDFGSAEDVARRLEEALTRFAVAGRIAVVGNVATLQGSGPTVSVDLGPLIVEWPGLPEETRKRRVGDVARRLAMDRRALSSVAPRSRGVLPDWVRLLGIVAGTLLLGLAAIRVYELSKTEAAVPSRRVKTKDYDSYENERAARAARVCDATRARILRGAAIGPSDVEGWVVELWALRDPARPNPAAEPALGAFVSTAESGRVVWKGAPALAALEGPDTSVAVSEADVPETGTPKRRGVRLVLSGRYVVPYFDDVPRQEYIRLARALTDELGAENAALYARCSDAASHHIGSWFRGPTPGGAAASLVYFMTAFGEHSDLRKALLVPPGAASVDMGYAYESVTSAALPLKKARVMSMIGPELGMIAGVDGGVSTITFPFRDANRASRAAHAIARELGVSDR
jgi:hypothetical protein